MADNFCQFSSQLKFISEAAATALENYLKKPETVHANYVEYGPPCEIIREDPHTLWLYSMDYFDEGLFTDILIHWAAQYPDEYGIISYSYSCSKARVDEFGGNVIAFSGGKVKHFSPWESARIWMRKNKVKEEETTE